MKGWRVRKDRGGRDELNNRCFRYMIVAVSVPVRSIV